MYKVFINKTPIVLTDDKRYVKKKGWKVIRFIGGEQLKEIVLALEKGKSKESVAVFHFDIDELWTTFINQFKFVHAAGGLVINDENEFLMIYRNNKWDLPKGHLKKGEQPEFGGMREVEEECGISSLTVKSHLANTYHMYDRKGLVLKKTFWYIMHSNDKSDLIPQLEEGITEVCWKTKSDIQGVMKKSYAIIGELLEKGIKKK